MDQPKNYIFLVDEFLDFVFEKRLYPYSRNMRYALKTTLEVSFNFFKNSDYFLNFVKNEFKKGDLAVYFEVDSFLPVCDKFEFLRKTSYKKSNLMGEGFRLRTMKMRGEISQGLLQPISVLPEGDWKVGDDVTEILGVKKWEIEEVTDHSGTIIAELPEYITKTD